MTDELSLGLIERCFSGVVPAVIATCGADGMPNVTYLSRAHPVDHERIALSNQFFSKTARNLAENPQASLLLVDPITHQQYRVTLVYERTERRGPVFDRLKADVEAIAALTGMQDVFRLRAADIYRAIDVVEVVADPGSQLPDDPSRPGPDTVAVAEMCTRISRCPDLDTLMTTAISGMVQLLGYEHVHLMLLDESGRRLYTMASHGFDAESIGAEIEVGEGMIGMAAAHGRPSRVGNLHQMAKYARTVRRSWEDEGIIEPGHSLRVPGLRNARSRLAVPAMALGQLVGMLVTESEEHIAFGPGDEAALTVIASLFASSYESLPRRRAGRGASRDPTPPGREDRPAARTGDAGAVLPG